MDIFFDRRNAPENVVYQGVRVTSSDDTACPTGFLWSTRLYVVYQKATNIHKRYTENVWVAIPQWTGDTMIISGASQPFITFDMASNISHLIYWETDTLKYVRSHNFLQTFVNGSGTTVTQGSQGTIIASSIVEQQASIVLHPSSDLYVSYVDGGNVLIKRSMNLGKTWTSV